MNLVSVLISADGGPDGVKKLHSCSVCGRSYTRPYRLKEHLKIHAADEPLHCSVCTKAFASTSSLRAHEKIHMASKPHPCSICPKSFLRPCLLRKHMRIHIRDGLIAEPADTVRPEHPRFKPQALNSDSVSEAEIKTQVGR